MSGSENIYDFLIVGSGVSGSFLAMELTQAGHRCLMLEAGSEFPNNSYPEREVDAAPRLYWSAGVEFNTNADLGLLRPKVVGGGSVVNQALMDRFDDLALDEWCERSGLELFRASHMASFYERAEAELSIQQTESKYWNRNARIFEEGSKKCGFGVGQLKRAQSHCDPEKDDCIECLHGCRLGSKQSMPVTTLKKAKENGLELVSDFEVAAIDVGSVKRVRGQFRSGETKEFSGRSLILGAGAIGNCKLIQRSGYQAQTPNVGRGFYTHPQEMVVALFQDPVNAFEGPFQVLKSDDPIFREQGFKLENVFAHAGSLAVLLSGYGEEQLRKLKRVSHMALIEVAVRDTCAGEISTDRFGRTVVKKGWNQEDRRRRDAGLKAIHQIFEAAGAESVEPGSFSVGLHLMGGCAIGNDSRKHAVAPNFEFYGLPGVYTADSSIFPSAPGMNPSLSIMANSLMAADQILSEVKSG